MNDRLGIDLGGSKIAGIVLDAADRVRAWRRVDTPKGDYAATLATIVELVAALEADVGTPGLSVGIGTPGSVVPATGLMRNANSQCLNGRPLQRDLAGALNRSIRLANDADCLALSESYDGAAAGAASVFAVILGTGVGGGIVVDGRLLSGPNGLAGEWGHNPLPWADAGEIGVTTCWCGSPGCLETWLSGPALAADYHRRYGRRGGGMDDARAIVARAEAGEARAGDALAAWLHRLARALAQVVNLFDPHAIVIGGGLSQIARIYDEVPRLWVDYTFANRIVTPLKPALHGDASGVRGAARLWPLGFE